MTKDKTVTMSRELAPCPFCGCQMRIETGRDTGHRMYGDHTQKCVFPRNSATAVEITEHPDSLTRLIEDWNTRAAPVVESQELVAWRSWSIGDTVRYLGSGEDNEDCYCRMMIGSDYLIHEAPDEFEMMLVLDDDGDELGVLVGEFEFIARDGYSRTSPPAPVSVVLPTKEDFKVWADRRSYDLSHGENGVFNNIETREAWFCFKAGADKVKELNPSRPERSEAPANSAPSGEHHHNDGLDEYRNP